MRAAAQSAVRGGLHVTCADLFADQDVRQLGNAVRVRRYPADLPSIARDSGAAWAMYTGALENHPTIVDEISMACKLLGNSGQVLNEVRDPVRLHVALQAAGLATPTTTRNVQEMRGSGWLRKPIRSCGGTRIAPCHAEDSVGDGPWYFQQFVDGISHAGAYLASGRQCLLLGVTRQLVGCHWLGATGFTYCGSIGPVPPPSEQLGQWQDIGRCLVERFGLRGLFGVDAVVSGDRVWPVEVNPRYTASMEVIERMSSSSLVALHATACRENQLPTPELLGRVHNRCAGKAVVFADRDLTVSGEFLAQVTKWNGRHAWPAVADIPDFAETIRQGRPVVTLFAQGRDPLEVEQALRTRATEVHSLLK